MLFKNKLTILYIHAWLAGTFTNVQGLGIPKKCGHCRSSFGVEVNRVTIYPYAGSSSSQHNLYERRRMGLYSTETDTNTEDKSSDNVPSTLEGLVADVTEGEWEIILKLVEDADAAESEESDNELQDEDEEESETESKLEQLVADALARFEPRLVMTMKKIAASSASIKIENEDKKMLSIIKVSSMLEFIMDKRLQSGRDLLKEFLDAGEIRKLDSLIGKAVKGNRLDMAFFTVLNMNIKDAFEEAQAEGSDVTDSSGGVPMTEFAKQEDTPEQGKGANRLQILQHIHTRCQEEVEKQVQPGVGLLNKLLRTEMPPIRKNQLEHYLSPQSSLTLPDGKVIPLQTSGKALVPPMELVSAMSSAVTQIRQVERAGGTDRKTAADLVESIRQIAIEARLVIIASYGETSDELKEYQNGLQPVFRPGQKLPEDDDKSS